MVWKHIFAMAFLVCSNTVLYYCKPIIIVSFATTTSLMLWNWMKRALYHWATALPLTINWMSRILTVGLHGSSFHEFMNYSVSKQWQLRSDAAFYRVWSGAVLFVHVQKDNAMPMWVKIVHIMVNGRVHFECWMSAWCSSPVTKSSIYLLCFRTAVKLSHQLTKQTRSYGI